MSDELPTSKKQNQSLDARFASRPHVYARLQQIADMMDEAIAQGCTADEAEARAVEQIQQLGRGSYSPIGGKPRPSRVCSRHRKKTLRPFATLKKIKWFTTLGVVEINEQLLRLGRRGPELRPFCERAQVRPRGYSRPLQRVLTDFGAESSFGRAAQRIKEHYAIELPPQCGARAYLEAWKKNRGHGANRAVGTGQSADHANRRQHGAGRATGQRSGSAPG
jgi:hypothetical protein